MPALTGLRAVAALLVLFHHFRAFDGYWKESWLAENGNVGVTVFFTLSGFLITRIYFERFRSGSIGFGEYWLRRFARIWPPDLAVLLLNVATHPASATGAQALILLTLSQGLFPGWRTRPPSLGNGWSLTVEECFYLGAPLLFLLLGRSRRVGVRALQLLASLGTVALIWACLRGSRLAGLILGNPVAVYFGKISYVFYLLQEQNLWTHGQRLVRQYLGLEPGRMTTFLSLTLASVAIYEGVERPAHRWLLSLSAKLGRRGTCA